MDFEFPYVFASGSVATEGVPYKSNGGEMVESELGEIPLGWEVESLGNISNCLDYLRKPFSEIERREIQGIYPYYGAMSIVDYINKYNYDGIYLLFSEDGANIIDEKGHPALQYIWGKFWVNNHAHILLGKDAFSTEYLNLSLKNVNVSHLVTGAAQPKISQQNMNSIKMLKPNPFLLKEFDKIILPFFRHIRILSELNDKLQIIKNLLLSKLATINN